MYRDMVASGRPSRSHPSPPGASDAAARVAEAARAESARGAPLVIAVSGGRDSMVLMEAVAQVAPARVASVATFDHGTGPAAVEATSLVRERASALGLPVRSGASRSPAHTEADWRAQRLAFLHEVAGELNARVITAHTLDDHLETVLMRALRGAGARGLAGLLASSAISRPFVTLRRSTIAACARAWAVPYLDDPTNVSRRHLRNRVRLDLLPALARAHPELPRDLVTLSRRAGGAGGDAGGAAAGASAAGRGPASRPWTRPGGGRPARDARGGGERPSGGGETAGLPDSGGSCGGAVGRGLRAGRRRSRQPG